MEEWIDFTNRDYNHPCIITWVPLNEAWFYNGAVKDEESFIKRYSGITKAICKIDYIKGYCYTQLTDVMQEVNGLMTADRKTKVNAEEIRKINEIK